MTGLAAREIAAILGPEGLLSQRIHDFSYRVQQQEMAEAIAQCIDSRGLLITEAGTGTGKTFAYLVPALLSGRKVIISTGTRNLQDQLYHRDLPVIRNALDLPVAPALLKGRSNYLCVYRLDKALSDGRLPSREQTDLLQRVRSWAGRTASGDRAELSEVPENAPVWPLVTSTVDNCLGQECPVYSDCHLAEARRKAQEADVLVINHHLLCADLALKDEGFGELLPGADVFIVDEAHQLPGVASDFFGLTVSGRQFLELARDTETEYHREAGDMAEIPQQADALAKAVRDLRLLFGTAPRRGSWLEISGDEGILDALHQLRERLNGLGELLESARGRSKGLDSVLGRCVELNGRLADLCDQDDDGHIRWFETQRQSFRLNRTPLEIADTFHAQMERHSAGWVFTSATLSVAESFALFEDQLGLQGAETHCWDSPFDYPNQALWYVPRGMPDPASGDYDRSVAEVALKIIDASGGRAFLLFTSHRALQAAAEYLKDIIEFPILVQGSAPRAELLSRFRTLGNAVLLGTASFWEGVDVRGSALSCVLIDKLPFASPGDPLLQARLDGLRARGANPFMEYQVPQAVIALKQGAGRLIRDITDRGVLVVCDPRLLSRPYGRAFINSLPPMARTREFEDVRRFFAQEAPS